MNFKILGKTSEIKNFFLYLARITNERSSDSIVDFMSRNSKKVIFAIFA